MSMAFTPTRIESAEETDARRVAPIRGCVLRQELVRYEKKLLREKEETITEKEETITGKRKNNNGR
jgi:hypothetical protein